MKPATITLIIITMILGAFYLTAPTDGDISACVGQTGWSVDRCYEELSR